MQRTFTIYRGTDVVFRIPLQRDGVDEAFGSNAKVWLTIEGLVTVSTETDPAKVDIPDPLANLAYATIARTVTASAELKTYRAQCVVQREAEDEQVVWEAEVKLKERLTAVSP